MERKIQRTLVMILRRVGLPKQLPFFCEYGMEIMKMDTQCAGDTLGQGLYRIRRPLSSFYVLPGVNVPGLLWRSTTLLLSLYSLSYQKMRFRMLSLREIPVPASKLDK